MTQRSNFFHGKTRRKSAIQATNGEYSKSELVLVLNRTDNGRPYRCEASNAASDEPKSGVITMAVLFKPNVVKIT